MGEKSLESRPLQALLNAPAVLPSSFIINNQVALVQLEQSALSQVVTLMTGKRGNEPSSNGLQYRKMTYWPLVAALSVIWLDPCSQFVILVLCWLCLWIFFP